MNDNIFVSVASYNDPMLFFTLNELFTKANNPQNLRIGILDQNIESQKFKLKNLSYFNQLRYVYVNISETNGVSWARNVVFSLCDDEKYILQIDSHTMFNTGWDTAMIEQYNNLLRIYNKPIISAYPHAFNMRNNAPIYEKSTKNTVPVLRPLKNETLKPENPELLFLGKNISTTEPVLGCHLAGGYIFTNANFIQEVPYDPFLYFTGEEQSLAIRAYTRGWNIYHPSYIPLYHYYKLPNVEYKNQHWYRNDMNDKMHNMSHLMNRSRERLIKLLYTNELNDTVYGLGTKRTMDDFIIMSGIDYKNLKITDPYNGLYEN